MKNLALTLAFFGISAMACNHAHSQNTAPKFAAKDCVENVPDDEFNAPDTFKILVVGKKRYQYVTYDHEDHTWSDLKSDRLFQDIDRDFHQVKCPR